VGEQFSILQKMEASPISAAHQKRTGGVPSRTDAAATLQGKR